MTCEDFENSVVKNFLKDFVGTFIKTSKMVSEEPLVSLEGKYLAMNGTNSECFFDYLSTQSFTELFLKVHVFNHSIELSESDRKTHVKEAFEDMFATIHSSYLKCTPDEVYDAAFNEVIHAKLKENTVEEKQRAFCLRKQMVGLNVELNPHNIEAPSDCSAYVAETNEALTDKWVSIILGEFFTGENPQRVISCLKQFINDSNVVNILMSYYFVEVTPGDIKFQKRILSNYKTEIVSETLECFNFLKN